MMEHDGTGVFRAPVLVEDLDIILGGNERHDYLSKIQMVTVMSGSPRNKSGGQF